MSELEVRRQGQHLPAEVRAELQAKFIEVFEQIGLIGKAAEQLNLHASTIANWRRSDPAFAKRFDEAREVADLVLMDQLERARTDGLHEVTEAIHPLTGKIVTLNHWKQDARVLLGAASARLPEYRPAQKVELSGPGGRPVELLSSPSEARGVLRLLEGARALGLLPEVVDGDTVPVPTDGMEAAG